MAMQGSELKACRERMSLTQGQLADELGLSPQFIGMMERGEKPIEVRTELAVRFLLQNIPTPKLPSEPRQALDRVQELVSAIVPAARCELQDYQFRIGCGAVDAKGNIQDIVFIWRGQTENDVLHLARLLEAKLQPGGSSAS
jgi:DNA-binding XRE family transcriptional regulator